MSVPFFLEPRFDANVNVVLPGASLKNNETLNYGPWLFEKISKWAEYKGLMARMVEERKDVRMEEQGV